jgi:hypothetical protein
VPELQPKIKGEGKWLARTEYAEAYKSNGSRSKDRSRLERWAHGTRTILEAGRTAGQSIPFHSIPKDSDWRGSRNVIFLTWVVTQICHLTGAPQRRSLSFQWRRYADREARLRLPTRRIPESLVFDKLALWQVTIRALLKTQISVRYSNLRRDAGDR